MNSEPTTHIELPQDLREALQRFQRRWRWISALTVLGLLALIPLLSFMLLSFSDRIWDTPQWARWVLALPVPVLMVAAVTPFVKRWVLDVPDSRRLAKVMGRLDPTVGDRLLGAVELSSGADSRWAGSPALRQAAIQQVSRELSNVRTEERLDSSLAGKALLGSAVIALTVLAFAWISPQAAGNSLQRWLRPYQELDRFTFVRLMGFPDRVVVPHGEPFTLEGTVEHVDEREVGKVSIRSDGPEQLELIREGDRLKIEAEGMTSARTVQVTAGDARKRTRVHPLMRPELVGLGATVEWPDYLQQEASEVTLRRRRLEVPIGSRVSLRADISREVAEVLGSGSARIEGRRLILPDVAVDDSRSLEFAWIDSMGLQPREPTEVQLIARPDRAPSVSLNGMGRTVAILEDEFVELRLRAGDDFGLQRVWNRFSEQNREFDPYEKVVESGLSGKEGETDLGFAPQLLGFGAGSRIELVALATDAYPGRVPSESSRFQILVLSKAEHAKLVLQQMDRVLADLDESIRQEGLGLEENQMTAERSEEDLLDESTTETLVDRSLDELARSEQLDQTRERLENLLVEASKNEEIGDQQIAEWATISENLKNEALPAMQAAAAALQQAAESTQPAENEGESERAQKLSEAIEAQKKALEAMRHGEEDLDESIVNSLSESFINRFRELAQEEGEIRTILTELLPQTIGLRTEDLPEELKETLLAQAEAQLEINRRVRYIYDDLQGFFRRVQEQVLMEITEEMSSENYQERLSALEALIRRNTVGLSSGEAETWSGFFLSWAQKLEDEKQSGPPPGQGGGSADEEGEDLETMIALIRARERQETLRRKVRALDQTYETNITFHRDAVLLADEQYEMARSLQPLENKVKKDETKQLISIASGEMLNAGVRLRRPDTGQDTVAIQTTVIELIAQALDQSMGSQPPPQNGNQAPQQNSASIMQAIMQMMQNRQPGAQPSSMAGTQGGEGQTGGGDPGEQALGRPGVGGADGTSDRKGSAGGGDPSVWPGQYRGMMDDYFQEVETAP